MIVAAKLQFKIDELSSTKDRLRPGEPVAIDWRSLAYAYNAYVYYNPKAPYNPDFHANIVPRAKELEKLRGYQRLSRQAMSVY